jgi:O-antigen/teichoic acid export membrane protein
MTSIQYLKQQYKRPALKAMGIYTFTNFLGKGLSFLLLPLFTNPKYLSPADNGLLSLFSQAVIFILPFLNLGILQSASTDYFKLDKNKFRDFCTTGFAMSAVMTVISFLVLFFFSDQLSKTFLFPRLFIWAIPLLAFLNFCNEFVILLIRNRDEPFKYMRLNITRILTELGLAVILIVLFSLGWHGRVSSMLIATGLIAVYGIYFLYRNDYFSGSIKKEIIYAELKFSLPVIVMQLSMFCLFSSDSFMIAGITKSKPDVGIYGIACVFGSVLITLSSALIQYMIPKINTILSRPVINNTELKKYFRVYFSIMLFSYLAVILLVPIVYHLFINSNYWDGIRYFCFLATGYFFWTITIFLYSFLLFFKQKRIILKISLGGLILSITSNYFFIKSFGPLGASVSVACCYLVVMIIAFMATQKYWRPLIYSPAR